MTGDDVSRFANAWIWYWNEYETTGQFPPSMLGISHDDFNESGQHFRLEVILNILGRVACDPDDHLTQVLAAGPLVW
jgi:hypothetical protein